MDIKSAPKSNSNRQPSKKGNKPGPNKKTLKEVAGSMLLDMIEKAHEERMQPVRVKQKEQEDEIAMITFGPNWNDSSNQQIDFSSLEESAGAAE